MIHIPNIVRDAGQAEGLRADQAAACPAVVATSQVMIIMRHAGRKLGLGPQVLRTLEIMLSCLAPKRNHHIVFASNHTLSERSSGLSERSLRRHIHELKEAGLLERSDSANGKRYSCKDPVNGLTLRFGLNFAPLFARLPQLEQIAQEAEAQARQLAYLKRKLRAACQRLLHTDPDNSFAKEASLAARRNISIEIAQSLIEHLPSLENQEAASIESTSLSSSAGQNGRLSSNFSTELIDKNCPEQLEQLLDYCSEAQSFAYYPVTTKEDIIAHAQELAPMIGIKSASYQRAVDQHGAWTISALIYLILQSGSKILKPAAYFQAATLAIGPKSCNPWRWLKASLRSNHAIVRGQQPQLPDCPRTTFRKG